jgi:outer membrane protein OmpA-like peptidoglycan-associated protein
MNAGARVLHNDQNDRLFAMTKSQPLMTAVRAILLASACALAASSAMAQSSSSVTVDLSAIDAPAPAPTGRIVLRPPMGTAPINANTGPVKLRSPERAAPKPAAPKPAPVVAAKPVEPPAPAAPVQAAAAPTPTPPAAAPRAATPAAPARQAATPAPTAVAPAAAPRMAEAPKPAATPTPPPAATPTPPTTTVPSAAAARSAQQEPVGPVASPMPTNQQSAALPPSSRAEAPSAPTENVAASLTIPFAAGVTDIDVGSQGTVKDLAQRMSSDKSLRVQLMAYATDPDKNTSKARRLSLDRAVAIRNMLIESGVERTRIEVRALGDQGEGGNLDRVDAVAIKR